MGEILSILGKEDFYFAMLRTATPVLLTTLGAMTASRAGVSNIALEGTMLFAAFFGVIVSAFSQSALLGFLAAVGIGLLSYFIVELHSNGILSGIALNTLASGGTIFLLFLITGEKGASTSLHSLKLPALNIPLIENIPFVGKILSGQHILTYLSLLLVFVIATLFKKSRLGMEIIAVGENPEAAESLGISVKGVKRTALLISGALTGMAGAFLSMGYVGLFSAGMTAGRGYIALATQAIAGGNAYLAFLASLLFGFCQSMANYLQNTGGPLQFIQLIPYLSIVVAYCAYCRAKLKR